MDSYYFQRLHFLLGTLAALIVTAICIYQNETLYVMAGWVSSTIICFYVIGIFVRSYIATQVFPPPPPPVFELSYEQEDSEDSESGLMESEYLSEDETPEDEMLQEETDYAEELSEYEEP